MGDPFEKVAAGLNRDLAWLAGGLLAVGGAVVTAGYLVAEVFVHRHRDHRQEHAR